MDTRAVLQALSNAKIKSNGIGGKTRAADIREVNDALIDSLVALIDDLNTPGGYMGIDENGIVDVTKIKKTSPTGQYLRDDGTWQNVVTTPTIAAYTISSNTIDLSLYSGEVILNIQGSGAITLNKLVGFTNVTKLTLRPKSGVDITVNDGSVSSFVSMKLAAPTLVIYGTNFGFLEFTKRNDGSQDQMFQTNFIDQYT